MNTDDSFAEIVRQHGETMHQIGIEKGWVQGRQHILTDLQNLRDDGVIDGETYYKIINYVLSKLLEKRA